MKLSDQIHVGVFSLDGFNTDLYAIRGEGSGWFYFNPEKGARPRIKVGLEGAWWHVVSVLLHEAQEMAMANMRVRFSHACAANDHASYVFMFDHCQFADLCETVGGFLTEALPALSHVYNREQKRKEKKSCKRS